MVHAQELHDKCLKALVWLQGNKNQNWFLTCQNIGDALYDVTGIDMPSNTVGALLELGGWDTESTPSAQHVGIAITHALPLINDMLAEK